MTFIKIDKEHSPYGIHGRQRWLSCGKRAALQEQHSNDNDYFERPSGMLKGSIGHAYLEAFFSEAALPPEVEFGEIILEESSRAEGQRGAEALIHMLDGDKSGFGSVLKAEMRLEGTKVTNAAYSGKGAAPFTARLDLVTSAAGPRWDILRAQGFEFSGAVECLTSGPVIWDYKFRASRSNDRLDRALCSLQYTAYQTAYAAEHKPAVYLVEVGIYLTKKINIELIVVPPPSAKAKASLALFMRRTDAAMARGPAACPSDENCFPFFGICPFFVSGECERC